MGDSKKEFLVYLVYADKAYGVSLKKSITYNELVAIVKNRFKFSVSSVVLFTYEVGTKCVYIENDADVKFFISSTWNSQGTTNTLNIKKIDQCLDYNPTSSNHQDFNLLNSKPTCSKKLDFDLNENAKEEYEENLETNSFKKIFRTPQQQPIKKAKNEYEENWETNTFKNIFRTPPQQPINKTPKNYNIYAKRVFKPGDKFDSKKLCKYEIGYKAILEGYEFNTLKTDKFRYEVMCVNKDCKWKITSRKCDYSSGWVIKKVNDHHTCEKRQIGMYHRNARAELLGHLLAPKFKDNNRIYKGKEIQHDINWQYNLNITYKQAWRSKNYALIETSGCPIKSFSQLPFYCHNLELTNDGTITSIDTDDEGRFKMVFVAFGVAIESFKYHMRPLIIIDAAHLKGPYLGTNLVAVGMDGNNQIILIATGVTQGETGASWSWFLTKLKDCIGENPNLAIISDRHVGILASVKDVFPNAFHGYCCRHLMMNCNIKADKLTATYWKMCKAYTVDTFNEAMMEIRAKAPAAYKKLIEAGVEKWSRAHCPSSRYNYMTSNSVESINSLTKDVRKLPVTNLLEWYRCLVQERYCERRENYAEAKEDELSPWATRKITMRMNKSLNWLVAGIEMYKVYQVDDRRRIHIVELCDYRCTCRVWQISGLPCAHALAVCRCLGLTDFSQLSQGWFRTTALKATYQGLVYPVGEISGWQRPNYLQRVQPPIIKRPSGRPKGTSRILSQNEVPVIPTCGRCGSRGHYRQGCLQAIPTPPKKAQNGATQEDGINSQQTHYDSQPFHWDAVNLNDP